MIEDRQTPMSIPSIYVLGLSYDEDDDKFTKGFPMSIASQQFLDSSQESPCKKCKVIESYRFTRDELNNSDKARKEFLMFCQIPGSGSNNNYIKVYSIIISFERF